jgi:hypothetical protein
VSCLFKNTVSLKMHLGELLRNERWFREKLNYDCHKVLWTFPTTPAATAYVGDTPTASEM